MSGSEKRYKTLNGTMALQGNIVGFCRLHRVHLTAAQVRDKDCIPKKCRALKKWDHPYWDHKQRMKEVRKLKKEQGIPSWQKVEIRTDRNGELLPKMKKKR